MKNFSLRNLASSLDDIYQDDYQEFIKKNAQSTISDQQLQEEKEMLLEWEIFQSKELIETVAAVTLIHDSLKICISDFIKGRQTTMEFWVRVAYDLFYDEKYGKTIRNKIIEIFEDGEKEYISNLQNRKWPEKWKDIKTDSCLNLEIIKLYLDYIPIRLYLAKQIKENTNILVDVGRMPYIQEEYSMRVMIAQQCTYFPMIRLPHHELLNQLSSCRNNYCQSILNYIEEITPIALQILNLLNQNRDHGRTINIFGEQSKFMYQLLTSLRILGASKIFPILRGIKVEKIFDFFLKNKAKNNKSDIIITQMTQEDINIDILTDIKNNYKDGYAAFVSKRLNNYKAVKRLILIFSSFKLKFGEVEHYVQFYKCQDNKINEILEMNQFNFLSFYSNMLMNVCELEFRAYSVKTKISSIMYCMWSYVLAKFFYQNFDIIETEITQNNNKEVDNQTSQLNQIDFEIQLSDSDEQIEIQNNLEIQDLPRKIKKSN